MLQEIKNPFLSGLEHFLQTEVIGNFCFTDVNKSKSMLFARGFALYRSLCGCSISGKLLKQYTFFSPWLRIFAF